MSVVTSLQAERVVQTMLTPEPALPLARTSVGTVATLLASRQIGTLTLLSPGVQIGTGSDVTRAEYLALLARVVALEAGTAPTVTAQLDFGQAANSQYMPLIAVGGI